MENSDYKRLARAEAMANYQKSQLLEVLRAAYEAACDSGDEQAAADAARALRNKLLDLSDKEMSLDRLGLDIRNMVTLLATLGTIFAGEWATYRQALRDLPQQEGFPLNVIWPSEPVEYKEEVF